MTSKYLRTTVECGLRLLREAGVRVSLGIALGPCSYRETGRRLQDTECGLPQPRVSCILSVLPASFKAHLRICVCLQENLPPEILSSHRVAQPRPPEPHEILEPQPRARGRVTAGNCHLSSRLREGARLPFPGWFAQESG